MPRLALTISLVFAAAGCPGPYTPATTEGSSSGSGGGSSEGTTPSNPSTTVDPTGTSTTSVDPTTGGGPCEGPASRCVGDQYQVCAAGQWLPATCPAGQGCQDGATECQPCTCTQATECADPATLESCGCFDRVQTPCPEGQACDADEVACKEVVCVPGEVVCDGPASAVVCNKSGTGVGAPVTCDPGELCDEDGGGCQAACTVVAKNKSSTGCEFWAVDMANVPPRDAYVYALAVSNPSDSVPAQVDIFDGNKNGAEQKLLGGVVPPRQVKLFLVSGKSNNQQGFYPGDAGFLGTGVAKGRAFRIASDMPIVATQFNPLGGALAFTTDASLLLPTHALGTKYYHLAWDLGLGAGSSLVAVATAPTTIKITPTVDTVAGQNGLPALKKGVEAEVSLQRYDYVQLSSNTGDLTGTVLESDQPIAVFGGHSCGQVPNKMTDFCDHLEEQIFPVDTWGQQFVALRSPKRGDEDMFWRVLARENGAKVTFSPKPEGLDAAVQDIPPGGFIGFSASSDFQISSNNPILVAGYMYGCAATGDPTCPGDPSMVLMVPVEQWQADYVFLVDSSYTNDNARLVRLKMNDNVTVGCLGPLPADHWQEIPGTQYMTATVNINPGEGMCTPGTNTAFTSKGTPFGIIVTGEAGGASYAYPGGLALREIAPG